MYNIKFLWPRFIKSDHIMIHVRIPSHLHCLERTPWKLREQTLPIVIFYNLLIFLCKPVSVLHHATA